MEERKPRAAKGTSSLMSIIHSFSLLTVHLDQRGNLGATGAEQGAGSRISIIESFIPFDQRGIIHLVDDPSRPERKPRSHSNRGKGRAAVDRSMNHSSISTREDTTLGGESPGQRKGEQSYICLLYTSPSPRDRQKSRMPSSA